MNKNKKVVKAMSSVLCASMLMGNVAPVFAATTDTQTTSNETDSKEVEVTYNKSASYFVTIPKTITLDSNKESTYNVKVEGDIPSDKNVYVAPEDAISQTNEIDFYMHDQSTKHPKADVTAIVTQNKDTWDFEDVANGVEETTNKISASQLTAGNWKGTFNFNINMKDAEKEKGKAFTTQINRVSGPITFIKDKNITSWLSDKLKNINNTKYPSKEYNVKVYFSVEKELNANNYKTDGTEITDFEYYYNQNKFSFNDNTMTLYNNSDKPLYLYFEDLSSNEDKKDFFDVIVNFNLYNENFDLLNISRNDDIITIPSIFKDSDNITCKITSINSAFDGCEGLTSITIPNSVTSIEENAFADCINLTSITIPNSVTDIGAWVFNGCTSLTTITIPNSVTSIGENAFGNSGLTSITIPDNITKIERYAFYNCNNLKSVTYKGITYTNQTKLENALYSNRVELGNYAFDNTGLQ